MRYSFFVLLVFWVTALISQNPNPSITGDNMLCPEGTGVVSTQTFDTYQWKRRYFGSANTELLQGENSQTLVMDYFNYAGSYVSVTVSLNGASATSAEFFVDGYMFLPLFVISEGNYIIGPEGEFLICPGDSVLFTLGNSASVNVQWLRDGEPIPGANQLQLAVYQPGVYSVFASPEVCPDYVQMFGMDLVVQFCPVGLAKKQIVDLKIYPNPAQSFISVSGFQSDAIMVYRIIDLNGRTIITSTLTSDATVKIETGMLPKGIYLLIVDDHPPVKFIKD